MMVSLDRSFLLKLQFSQIGDINVENVTLLF